MKEVTYSSTRGEGVKYTASMAVLKGLASDGGLFVPDHIPSLDKSLAELADEFALSTDSIRRILYK